MSEINCGERLFDERWKGGLLFFLNKRYSWRFVVEINSCEEEIEVPEMRKVQKETPKADKLR